MLDIHGPWGLRRPPLARPGHDRKGVSLMNRFGFLRITCASTRTAIANPEANAAEVLNVLKQVPDSDVVVFPELGLPAYPCADLFGQAALTRAAEAAAARLAEATRGRDQLVV